MRLRYGDYWHDEDEVTFTISKKVIYDKFKYGRGYTAVWNIIGTKFATSNAELTSKLQRIEAEYGQNNKDLVFYDDDNNRVAWHTLENAKTFGGVRVLSFDYPNGLQARWGAGSEWVARRTFRIIVAADFLVPGGITDYREQVTVQGFGGPRQVWQGSLEGYPRQYLVQRATSQLITQQGYMVGDTDYPGDPIPVAPVATLHQERSYFTRHSPDIVVGGQRNFRLDWKYVFESSVPSGLVQTGGTIRQGPFSGILSPTSIGPINNIWPDIPNWGG